MEYDRADKEVAEMSKIKVNEQRAVDEFQELTAIDAPSFGERQMADRLIVKLKELGFEVEEDNAGKHFGGNAGETSVCNQSNGTSKSHSCDSRSRV